MKRKIVFLLLAGSLCLSACGKQPETEPVQQAETEANETEEAEPEEAEQPEEAEEPVPHATKEFQYQELAISGQYDDYGRGRGGVIPVCKDEKWGLVTYGNEVIVPLEYASCGMLNNDGQIVFGNEGDHKVFDSEGTLLFESADNIKTVNDGVVLLTNENYEDNTYQYEYRKLDGTVLFSEKGDILEEVGAVGYNEGYAIVNYTSIAEDGTQASIGQERIDHRAALIQAQREQENRETLGAGGADTLDPTYPIGIYHHGYYVDRGSSWYDLHTRFQVAAIDGTDDYKYDVKNLLEYLGQDPYAYDQAWGISGYVVNGSWCYSYGTIINAYLGDEGNRTRYLIDLSKLRGELDWGNYDYSAERFEGAILAEGETLALSDETYWLYGTDGKTGFIDHDGKVIELFDSAGAFSNGVAIMVDDGNAYFIDEDFNRSTASIPADTVSTYGEIYMAEKDGVQTFLEVER